MRGERRARRGGGGGRTHADGEHDGGDGLEAPRDAEGRLAVDVGAADWRGQRRAAGAGTTHSHWTKYCRRLGAGERGRARGVVGGRETHIPQVMDHCWRDTMRPRIAGAVISDW